MGNLTRKPEHKLLASGQAICKLGLATSRPTKSKGDQQSQEVCFIDVDVWGPQADLCAKYLDKGSTILIEGRLRWDSWSDQSGNKRSKHTLVADRVTFVRGGNASANADVDSSAFGDEAFSKGEIFLDNDEAFKDGLPF